MSGPKKLPSFEEMRRNAYKLLGDAQDELYSDWFPGEGPDSAQRDAATKALRHITKAKQALNEAANPFPSPSLRKEGEDRG